MLSTFLLKKGLLPGRVTKKTLFFSLITHFALRRGGSAPVVIPVLPKMFSLCPLCGGWLSPCCCNCFAVNVPTLPVRRGAALPQEKNRKKPFPQKNLPRNTGEVSAWCKITFWWGFPPRLPRRRGAQRLRPHRSPPRQGCRNRRCTPDCPWFRPEPRACG